jgi:hypothetical protein
MELRRKIVPSPCWGDRLNVEIQTPWGILYIELRSGTCIYAATYSLESEPMYLSLPDDNRFYIAAWRMVREDGIWVDWNHPTIEPRFVVIYTKGYDKDADRRITINNAQYHGVQYNTKSQQLPEEFNQIDNFVRPYILQWLNEHTDELKVQEITARDYDLKIANEAVRESKKQYEKAVSAQVIAQEKRAEADKM